MRSKSLGTLAERQFRLLFLGQAVSALGDGVVPVAISFAVLDLTGSATDLGLVLAAQSLPAAGLSLIAGVWADRLPRHLLMLASDVVRAGAQGLTAGLLLTGRAEIWQLVLLQALDGAAESFFRPAATALIPETISPARLQQANALVASSRSGGLVLGPALAGLLVAAVGPGGALAVDAATFLVSAASLALLRPKRLPRPVSWPARAPTFLSEVGEGFREVRSRTWLWLEIARASFTFLLVSGPFWVLGPLVARQSLGGAAAWGMIATAFALGLAVGGLLALRLRPRRPLFVCVALMFLAALAPALLALRAPAPAIAAAELLYGVGGGFFAGLWPTILQTHVPPRVLARVSAWDWMGTFAFLPLGYALAGPLSAVLGVETLLWIGVAWILVSVPALLSVSAVRTLTWRGGGRTVGAM